MSDSLDKELKPHLDPLYRFAMALTAADCDARDLVQETLLRAIKHQNQFVGLENKRAWLFKVMSNAHRDMLRQQQRRPPLNALAISIRTTSTPQRNMEIREQQNQVLGYFQRLPEVQRKVMYLRCVEEFSIKQIAESQSMTENNVKTNLCIARKKVKEMLKKSDDEVVPR